MLSRAKNHLHAVDVNLGLDPVPLLAAEDDCDVGAN